MISPSKKCTFSFAFERKPIFIAGRYCKFSRSLPQSPWTASEELPKVNGNSVSYDSKYFFLSNVEKRVGKIVVHSSFFHILLQL